jgi:outer membrane murein-binding lipoprotein Lpp
MNTDLLLGAVAVSGYVIAGVFALRGQWDTAAKQKRSEADELSDKLIERLQQTVDQQSKDLENMRVAMEKHTSERNKEVQTLRDDLKHLQGRNGVLEDLFRGRDPAMQAFLKDAPTLMEIARENNGLARETGQGLQKLEATLSRFVDNLSPLLIHLELKKPETAGV